jgi:pentatricopeptide repeat protein
MVEAGIEGDAHIYCTVLTACANLTCLAIGTQIHQRLQNQNILIDTTLANAIINMYGKCGDLKTARKLFDFYLANNHTDVHTWTSIICAYGHHGYGKEALSLLHSLLQHPATRNLDKITFVR